MVGGVVGRNWEELGKGNCNQNILYEKNLLSIKKENVLLKTTAIN